LTSPPAQEDQRRRRRRSRMLQAVAAVLVPLVAVNFTFPFSYCNLSTGTLVLDLVFSVDYPLVCVVWNPTECLYLLLITKNVFHESFVN